MHFLFTKQNFLARASCSFFLCLILLSQGLWAKVPYGAFNTKDIFQSAVFLSNKELIPDYKNEKIWFYSNHDHIRAYFTESGVLYKIGPAPVAGSNGVQTHEESEEDETPAEPVKYALVKLSWPGANPHPLIRTGRKAPGYHTYVVKNGKSFKSLQTEGYETITYQDLYPGIDIVYGFPDKGGIKYNLIVKPGADIYNVKLLYDGDVGSLAKNADGDILIGTDAGNMIEHAPVSFTENQQKVESNFTLTDNTIQFNFPAGYDKRQTLTVDPWVTAVTVFAPDNIGFDVDYDTTGNAFVYGAGPNRTSDATDFFEVAKYNTSGILSWTFAGSVGSISWSSWDGTNHKNYAGNILVEKSTGKVYVAKGHDVNGTTVIRLNTAGAYDNFQSAINAQFTENWGIGYNCVNSTLLGLGGGANSNNNIATINPGSGATATTNITGSAGRSQDIICGVFDYAGNLYVVMDDYLDSTSIPFHETLYKVNAALNGNVWSANTGYRVFSEEWNANYWQTSGSTNWNNCLAANGSYLFFYNGFNLAAFNLATGTAVGNATNIPGYVATYQGGIAVDNCNNVYIGGTGVIKTFHFDGTNFTASADIPLGVGFTTNSVEDVKYQSSTNTLFITGVGVVGTYAATLSTACNPISVTNTCTSATATVQGATGVTYSYTWTNSTGTVVSQTLSSAATTNTASGLSNGTYYVRVQWLANCNGSSIYDSVIINCTTASVTATDTTICAGGTATLTATGTPAGGTYSWSPGGGSGRAITVSPGTTTVYTVTYSPLTGSSTTGTGTVTVITASPTVSANDPVICAGQSATITANPSITGGTYSWSPGGATTSSITVTPGSTSTYTVTYSLTPCGSATYVATVTVNNAPSVSANNPVICAGQSATITANPTIAGGTYSWSPGGATTSSITVSPGSTSTYTVTYNLPPCGPTTYVATVTVTNTPSVSVNNAAVCAGGSAVLTATPSVPGGTYSWNPGGGTLDSITVSPGVNTTYTVTYTSALCGSATGSGTVTIASTANVTVNDTTICQGGTAILTATPTVAGGTFSWAPGGSTNSFISVSPGANTTYTVTYSPTGCAAATGTGTVTVAPLPALTLTTINPGCSSAGEIIANATGGSAPYQYALNNGTYQQADSFTNLAAGNDTVIIKDNIGCSSPPVATTIVAYVPLTVQATIDSITCTVTTGRINANAGGGTSPYQYSVNGGTYQNSGTFSGLAAGSYVLSVKDAAGCTITKNVVIPSAATITASAYADSVLCYGTATGSVIASGNGGSQPYQFALNGGAYQISDTFLSVSAGNYTVLVKDANGCSASATVQVFQPDSLYFVFINSTGIKCPGQKSGTITVVAGGGISPYSFSCTKDSANFVIATNGVAGGLDTGTYLIILSDTRGCTIVSSAFIPGALPDSFTVKADSTSCFGPDANDGTVSVTAVFQQNAPFRYSLNNGPLQSANTFSGLVPGIYNVTATDTNGCQTTLAPVTVGEPSPAFAAASPADTSVKLGQSVPLQAYLNGGQVNIINSYAWSPAEGLSCSNCQNPIVTNYAEESTYTVTVTYNGHCTADASVLIIVNSSGQVYIPNAFTPNGDGNNDIFYVYGFGIKQLYLKVFNRWGIKVFESSDQYWGWDGTYKGTLQDPAVFVYEANVVFLDNKTRFLKGSVTLIR